LSRIARFDKARVLYDFLTGKNAGIIVAQDHDTAAGVKNGVLAHPRPVVPPMAANTRALERTG
jgi:hypothetical protein